MKVRLLITVFIAVLLASCNGTKEDSSDGEIAELVVMTHDSFALSESVLKEFEESNNARVTLLPAGDTGAALNQAILAKDDPLADVFFGVDNTFIGRALEADIFEPYRSPGLEHVAEEFVIDDSYRLLPVDYGDVCLNYDKKWFTEQDLEPPVELTDLTDPAYEGLLVVQNPATSSPGLAFMLATIEAFGAEGDYSYLDYWRDLRSNGVLVTDGWEDAYFGHFSAAGEGDRPLVVSYASSPPAEVVYADPPIDESPTESITSPGSCFRQIEFIGIMVGTQQRRLAEAFVDFALGQTFQEDIPLNMFVFPVHDQAELPQVFREWADIAQEPATVEANALDENREAWINDWTEVVLR